MTKQDQIREARTYTIDLWGADFGVKCTDAVALAVRRAGRSPVESIGDLPLVLSFRDDDRSKLSLEPLPMESSRAMVAQVLSGRSRELYRDALECLKGSAFPPRESWLASALFAPGGPRQVAEIAAHPHLRKIDLARRLVREMHRSTTAVGAPGFRSRTGFDGSGVDIAVIDAEVDEDHPAMAGRVLQSKNFSDEDWGTPDHHASAVAGIIASDGTGSRKNSQVGIAPKSRILNYKIFPSGWDIDAINAVEQAFIDGAMTINFSWTPLYHEDCDSTCHVAEAVSRIWQLGVPVVKSAGNKGPSPGTITCPGNAENVICVGATDSAASIVEDFSSRGPMGGRVRPHVVAPGADITSCNTNGTFGPGVSGTSFAAAHVSGLLALLLNEDPTRTPDELLAELTRRARLLPSGGGPDDQGSGLASL